MPVREALMFDMCRPRPFPVSGSLNATLLKSDHAHSSLEKHRLGVQILRWHSRSVVESHVYSYPWVQSPCFVAPLFMQPDHSDGVRWVTVFAYRFAFFSLPYTKEMGLGIIRIYIFQLVPNHSSSLLPHSISASSWVLLVLRGASLIAQLVKNPPAMQETWVWIPGSGRSPGERNGNPLQYSCLENPMDRGAWWATVHGVAKSRTQLKQLSSA